MVMRLVTVVVEERERTVDNTLVSMSLTQTKQIKQKTMMTALTVASLVKKYMFSGLGELVRH